MKAAILKMLRKEGADPISGEALSNALGVSRVSVWKHIQKLQESGYAVEASSLGYRLTGSPDIPFSWEFPDRQEKIHYFDEVPSTMDVARELARKGCPAFTVVIAGRQTKGRGRLSRVWLSGDGGLYMTVVLRPELPPALIGRINFAASVAMCRTLRSVAGVDAATKWPNDLLVDGKKISGMLSEMEAEADRVAYLAIGIGVNVNNDPGKKEPKSVSVRQLVAKKVSMVAIVRDFLDRLEDSLADLPLENAVKEWKRHTCTIGRKVKIVTHHDRYEGTAKDIDEDGALVLEMPDGAVRRVVYGDCFLN